MEGQEIEKDRYLALVQLHDDYAVILAGLLKLLQTACRVNQTLYQEVITNDLSTFALRPSLFSYCVYL